jgi:hypothetical protein
VRTKHTFRLPPDLASKLADYAARKRVRQALIVEAALTSYLWPDAADRLEAALARRLDRISRDMERIERHITISNEALAVFVRFWLTSTPPPPDAALAAAQTKGREPKLLAPAKLSKALSHRSTCKQQIDLVGFELLNLLSSGRKERDSRRTGVECARSCTCVALHGHHLACRSSWSNP